ncbi:MAG: serine/threonine-protein kinase [Gemmataceae bacterium]
MPLVPETHPAPAVVMGPPAAATDPAAAGLREHVEDEPDCVVCEWIQTWFDRPRPDIPGYTLENHGLPIGLGGMGVVYLARQTGLNRLVALKLIRDQFAVSPASEPAPPARKDVDRLRQEGERLAGLQQSGIPAVYDTWWLHDRPAPTPYLALEYVAGKTLAEQLAGGWADDLRPSPDAVNDWLVVLGRVAEAVAVAHAAGCLHLDLKPDNVITGASPETRYETKVIDWGLSVSLAAGDAAGRDNLGGTPAYMPPEQAKNDRAAVGPGSDVFALGGMMCHVLTGRPTYRGTRSQMLEAARTCATGPALEGLRAERENYPSLVRLAERCLARNPARRPTVEEFLDTLRAYIRSTAEKARRAAESAARKSRAVSTLTTALALLAVGTVGVWAPVLYTHYWFAEHLANMTAHERLKPPDATVDPDPDARARALAAITNDLEALEKADYPAPNVLVAAVGTWVASDKQKRVTDLHEARRGRVKELDTAAASYRRYLACHDALDTARVTYLYDPNADLAARLAVTDARDAVAAYDAVFAAAGYRLNDKKVEPPASTGPVVAALEERGLLTSPRQCGAYFRAADALDSSDKERVQVRGWLAENRVRAGWKAVANPNQWLTDADADAVNLLALGLTREGDRASAVEVLRKYLARVTRADRPGAKPDRKDQPWLVWLRLCAAVLAWDELGPADSEFVADTLGAAQRQLPAPGTDANPASTCGKKLRFVLGGRLEYAQFLGRFILNPALVDPDEVGAAAHRYPDHRSLGGLDLLVRAFHSGFRLGPPK